MAFSSQLDDGALGHLRREGPAVPALAVLDLVEAAALAGAGQDHGGLFAAGRVGQGLFDLIEVMAVDLDGPGIRTPRSCGRTPPYPNPGPSAPFGPTG